MKVLELDKVFITNTDYKTEAYKGYVIKKLGTDDTAVVTPKINDAPLGLITSVVAPLHSKDANLLGPVDLGLLYYVVPPLVKLRFDGTATKKVRVQGKIIVLEAGEAFPSDLMARFLAQPNHYLQYVYGSGVATGTAWADAAEKELKSLTPTTIEKHIFNHNLLVQAAGTANPAETDGDVGVRLLMDDAPLDNLETTMGRYGLNRISLQVPVLTSVDHIPFSLKDNPVTVLPNHTLKVIAKNTSGGSLFGTTQETFTFHSFAEYIRTPA